MTHWKDDRIEQLERELAYLRAQLAEMEAMLLDRFARSTPVEEFLRKAASGKGPLPDADKCREMALRLGVPTVTDPASAKQEGRNEPQ